MNFRSHPAKTCSQKVKLVNWHGCIILWGILPLVYLYLQAKKQPQNYKFYTLLAFLFLCRKGIKISKIDQMNINTTCLNLLNNMKFVTTTVD